MKKTTARISCYGRQGNSTLCTWHLDSCCSASHGGYATKGPNIDFGMVAHAPLPTPYLSCVCHNQGTRLYYLKASTTGGLDSTYPTSKSTAFSSTIRRPSDAFTKNHKFARWVHAPEAKPEDRPLWSQALFWYERRLKLTHFNTLPWDFGLCNDHDAYLDLVTFQPALYQRLEERRLALGV